MNDFFKTDSGYYHLTQYGWTRQDAAPFPDDRIETWQYEMVCPADDAKEQVCLTKIWSLPGFAPQKIETLHRIFGQPLPPTPERNITLECSV